MPTGKTFAGARYRLGRGNLAGVRRDFEKLEQPRLEAAKLLRQGIHQPRWRAIVSRWAQGLEQGGKRAEDSVLAAVERLGSHKFGHNPEKAGIASDVGADVTVLMPSR